MFDKRRDFGQWLQERRLAAGFTQEGLAKRLGMAKPSVVTWENGGSGVPLRRLFDLARELKIPMEEMLEKLAACEPKKAREFADLETGFLRYFQERFLAAAHTPESLHMSDYQTQSNYGASRPAQASTRTRARFCQEFPSVINGLEGLPLFKKLTKIYVIRHWAEGSKIPADDYPAPHLRLLPPPAEQRSCRFETLD